MHALLGETNTNLNAHCHDTSCGSLSTTRHIPQISLRMWRKNEFVDGFNNAMYFKLTPDEFEAYWKKIGLKYGLEENRWVCKTYEIKHLWAITYLRENFFARIRMTSQCEAINSIIN